MKSIFKNKIKYILKNIGLFILFFAIMKTILFILTTCLAFWIYITMDVFANDPIMLDKIKWMIMIQTSYIIIIFIGLIIYLGYGIWKYISKKNGE